MADSYFNNLANMINVAEFPKEAAMIKKTIETSPLINFFPQRIANGPVLMYRNENKLPQIGNRAYGNPYSGEQTAKYSPGMIALSVFGGKFSTDRLLEEVPVVAGGTNVTEQVMAWARSFALDWKKFLFNASKAYSTGLQFDGLQYILQSSQVFDFETVTGSPNIAAATVQEIIEVLDKGIRACISRPSVICMNRVVFDQMRSMFVNANNSVAASVFTDGMVSLPGIQNGQMIQVFTGAYRGIPIIFPDQDSQGIEILGFDEDRPSTGTGANRSSIYFITAQPSIYEMIAQFPTGYKVFDRVGENGRVIDVDFPYAMWLKHYRGAARIGGIKETA